MAEYEKREERIVKERISGILNRNKDKTFVRRVLNPENFPVMNNEDGSVSTHRMASGESEGKHYVYPTILYSDGGLVQNEFKGNAFSEAMKAGQYIEFDNQEDASFFAENYKSVWE